MIAQDPFLFSASVRENLTFGRPEATDEEIQEAARLAQAHEFIERLPEGYETVIGERGDHALGRPAPAARDRARARRRSADPDPRRRDRLGRRHDRGADPARPARGDAGPDDGDHRPPRSRRSPSPTRSSCSTTAGSPPAGPRGGARRERGLPRDLRARPARGRDRRAGGRLDGRRRSRGPSRSDAHRCRRTPRVR